MLSNLLGGKTSVSCKVDINIFYTFLILLISLGGSTVTLAVNSTLLRDFSLELESSLAWVSSFWRGSLSYMVRINYITVRKIGAVCNLPNDTFSGLAPFPRSKLHSLMMIGISWLFTLLFVIPPYMDLFGT